jgi:iron complex outermembrane receptor protein
MQIIPSFRSALRRCVLLAGSAALVLAAHAQAAAGTGTVSGRVLNSTNGRYVGNVKVTVDGTQLQVLTDDLGDYRLESVPAGTVRVDVTYSGLAPQTAEVLVPAGGAVSQDFSMPEAGVVTAPGAQTVKLDEFVVAAQKETNAKIIAVNEQHYAPAIQKVVSADAFGQIFQDNIAEFVKFLPGVSIDYNSMDARWIMVRGLSPQYTPVYVDGMRMASAASVSESRYFETEEVSMNNVARTVESESRTPDIGADALGGSINMISKSALEYSHPELDYELYADWDGNHKNLYATPGPGDNEYSHKDEPGFDFTFVDPVSKSFGFTISALDFNEQNEQYRSNPQWYPNGRNSAPTVAPESNPFLEDYVMQDAPKNSIRRSLAGTADWKITPDDLLSFAVQENYYDSFTHARNITFDTSSTLPASYGPTFTNGAAGKGTISMGSSDRNKWGTTFNFNTRYAHTGPIWTVNASFEYSHAATHYADAAGGYFDATTLQLKSVTVDYAGNNFDQGVRPAAISVFTAGGASVNPFNYGSYNIVSALSDPENGLDIFHVWQASIARSFGDGVTTTVKLGSSLSWEDRNARILGNNYTFVGPTGAFGGTSAAAYPGLTDQVYSKVAPPYGFAPITWMSNVALYNLEQSNPSYFQLVQTGSSGSIATQVKNSTFIREDVPAIYLMGDTKALDNQLRFVYGVRGEETNDLGYGGLFDPNAIFAGDIPTGALLTTDPIAQTALEWKDRGQKSTVNYGSLYPSANVTYNFTSQLLVRAAYYRGLGRPNYNNIVGTYVFPADNVTGATITAPNPKLAPEEDNNYDVDLEYYNKLGGVASIGVFRKDFTNFFGSLSVPLTSTLANQLGIPLQYVNENDILTTPLNVGKARIQGVEINVSQPLRFDGLPSWGNGFSVFANTTDLHLEGSPLADFTNFIAKETNWGVNYHYGRFLTDLNWNWRGQEKMGLETGDPSGASYLYFKARLYLDLDFQYQLAPHVSIYMSGQNVTNVPQDEQEYGPLTPGYAHLVRREIFGPSYTVGIRGTF